VQGIGGHFPGTWESSGPPRFQVVPNTLNREPSTLSIPPPNGGGVYAEFGWALCSEHVEAALSGIGRFPGTHLEVLIIVHPVLPLLSLDV